MSRSARIKLLCLVTLLAAVITAFLPRIPQDLNYHNFADQRTFWNFPNTLNVLSNIPFVPVGILAIAFLLKPKSKITFNDERERWLFVSFFVGATLVGFGSGWYHLAPDNHRLVWDRLPMTIGFMGLISALIAERISLPAAMKLFPLLLLAGLFSVLYWNFSEQNGKGDLRPYAFVQFFSILLVPLLLWLFPAKYTRGHDYILVLLFYVGAKITEALDQQIYGLGHLVSGHSIKHLLAAAGVGWLLVMLLKRKPVTATS